jgi:hypothetical protein
MGEWEILHIRYDSDTGRPRYVNDEEIPGWQTKAPEELQAELEAQGWTEEGGMPPGTKGRVVTFMRRRPE